MRVRAQPLTSHNSNHTWVRATAAGRAAFAREIAALEALIRRVHQQ
jgi:hypothetical protein